jgi:hypothetical protein
MGQGSRGGNSGLSSSGVRQRNDKELKKAKENPRTVGKTPGGESGKGNGTSDNKKKKGGRGRGLLHGGHNFPNLGVPHLGSTSTGTKKKAATGSKAKKAKTVHPPAASKTAKIPTIRRVRGPKVKLTKQRTNKTPN